MVQIFDLPQSTGGILGQALGQGLQQGYQQYLGEQRDIRQEQRQLQQSQQEQARQQSVLNQALTQAQKIYSDPNLSPQQKEIGLFQALSSRPDVAHALSKQLQSQQEMQQEANKQNTRNQLFNRYAGRGGQMPSNLQEIPPQRAGIQPQATFQQGALSPGVNEPAQNMQNREITEDDIIEAEALGEHQLAQTLANLRNQQEKNKFNADRLALQKEQFQTEQIRKSYAENEDYINKIYDQAEDADRKETILDRMLQLDEKKELSDAALITVLDQFGIHPEILKNASNDEYNKLAMELTGGGALLTDYGSRPLLAEFQVMLRRIPTLMNTPEGRRQIIEDMKILFEPARLKKSKMEEYLNKAKEQNKPLPYNLRGQVLKDIKPQLDETYRKFKERNGRYKVKEGTPATQAVIEKYFTLSNYDDEKTKKALREDGYIFRD